MYVQEGLARPEGLAGKQLLQWAKATQEPLPELPLELGALGALGLALEPAPDGVLLPGLELPPLPASPPEPGRAVPLVLAPLEPVGADGLSDGDAEPPMPAPLDEPPMLLPPAAPPALPALVAAIRGMDRAQVSPAITIA